MRRLTGPFGPVYYRRHRGLLVEQFGSPEALRAFGPGGTLPEGYGAGLDERVCEYPWLFSHELKGKALDAGSALNHPHVLDQALRSFEDLSIVTLAPEAAAFTDRGISYVYADLRTLPFRDSLFDTVVSLSTIEHIGQDNTRYGADGGTSPDPESGLLAALGELHRVLKDGGRMLISVPYGLPEDHGWFRQFDLELIERCITALGPRGHTLTVFRYSTGGWQHSTPEAASGERYQAAVSPPAEDGAVAARAVACLDLQF